MPYYVTLSGGTEFELSNSFGDSNFKYSPTKTDDATLYPDLTPYVKPFRGVSTPPPEQLMYRFALSDLTRDTSYHTVTSYNWGNGVRMDIVYRLYWYQGDRWGYPSFDLRLRLYKDNVLKHDKSLYNTSGGATWGYGCLIFGYTPYEAFVVNGVPSYNMSFRVQLTLGADTIVRAEEEAIEKYNITFAAGYGSTATYLNGNAAHSVFTKAWLDSIVPGADPEYSDNGYYPGPYDGGHVPYEFIRRGINYLRTIDIYDETYTTHADNAAFLKNRVGELAYNGVEFAYPYIKIKAKTDIQFTHAVTASWSKNNRPTVYKVTNYHEIGNNLAEYTLAVDGLKTFFQYHTTTNPLVVRHTNSANWNKWIKDSVPYNGSYEYMQLTGTTMTVLYMVVVNATHVYGFTKSGFDGFKDRLLADNEQAKIVPQISACYMLPINLASKSGITAATVQIEFMGLSAGKTYTAEYSANEFATTTISINGSDATHNISDQSFLYDSHATLHAPGVGDLNAPADFIRGLVDGSKSVQYRFSLVDGTVSVSTWPYLYWSPTISLPLLTIPFNSEEVQMYNVNRNQQAGISNVLTSAVGGVVSGALVGGGITGAVVGGVIGAGSSLVNLNTSTEAQRDIIANSQGLSGASCTGAASMADMRAAVNFLVPGLAVSYPEYYKIVGYPVQKKLDDCLTVSGDTFWPVFSRADLSDKKEIVDDLLARASEGIYWNP